MSVTPTTPVAWPRSTTRRHGWSCSRLITAVAPQTITTNGIRRSAADAASGSDEITHNIAEVARAAQSTTSGASDTQAAALELARMASAPQELVGRFRC